MMMMMMMIRNVHFFSQVNALDQLQCSKLSSDELALRQFSNSSDVFFL